MSKLLISLACLTLTLGGCSDEKSVATPQSKTPPPAPVAESSHQKAAPILVPAKQEAAPVLVASQQEGVLDSKTLGARLLALLTDNPMASPSPAAIKQALPECNLQETAEGSLTYATPSCGVRDAAPGAREVEKIAIRSLSSNCCLQAVQITQLQSDENNGLAVFDTPGLTKETLSCPDIDADNRASFGSSLFLVKRNGKPQFTIREDYSAGSGGVERNTTVYFGKLNADCNYFTKVAIDFDNDIKGTAVPVVLADSPPSTTLANAIEVKTEPPKPQYELFEQSWFPKVKNWQKIGSDDTADYYFDPQSLTGDRTDATYRYVTIVRNFEEGVFAEREKRSKKEKRDIWTRKPDIRSNSYRLRVSCPDGKFYVKYSTDHSGAMGTGMRRNNDLTHNSLSDRRDLRRMLGTFQICAPTSSLEPAPPSDRSTEASSIMLDEELIGLVYIDFDLKMSRRFIYEKISESEAPVLNQQRATERCDRATAFLRAEKVRFSHIGGCFGREIPPEQPAVAVAPAEKPPGAVARQNSDALRAPDDSVVPDLDCASLGNRIQASRMARHASSSGNSPHLIVASCIAASRGSLNSQIRIAMAAATEGFRAEATYWFMMAALYGTPEPHDSFETKEAQRNKAKYAYADLTKVGDKWFAAAFHVDDFFSHNYSLNN